VITRLSLKNFRAFKDYTVPLKKNSIIIGKNNAGKSTIVEALRLISIVLERHRGLIYREVPRWLDIPKINRGVSPSLKNFEINFVSLFHKLGEPPAEISAEFEEGEKITVYIAGEEKIFAVIRGAGGEIITNKNRAQVELPQVRILPQISILQKEERMLDQNYVRSSYSSSLASIHFRNQLALNYGSSFSQFVDLAESSWPGLHIRKLEGRSGLPNELLTLMVQDATFVAEVGWLGHGLQMWLQIMWFLANVDSDSTVILDEPDVYMHIELQRKLIRLLKGRYHQMILSTHSTEILAEVEPDEVLIIDRSKRTSSFAASIPAVQKIVDHLGGLTNLQLTKLWSSKRFLLVEGKDTPLLKAFQNVVFPMSQEPIDTFPQMPYQGWGGWNYAVGSGMLLKNAAGDEITPYCIMDRDYHSKIEIDARYKDAQEKGIQLHIWDRKEIENYVLSPRAIHSAICNECGAKTQPSQEEVAEKLEELIKEIWDSTFDAISTAYAEKNRGGGINANKYARKLLADCERSFVGRISVVSGKEIVSKLSEWSVGKFGTMLTPTKIIKQMTKNEVDSEVVGVISKIEKNESF
jgi:energy-coupling factor transporter ATP-binding protein EcfA2